jgi:hypothetical protein
VGTAGLLVATAIASALILMQGAATWRLPAARPRLGLAAPASFDAADTPD